MVCFFYSILDACIQWDSSHCPNTSLKTTKNYGKKNDHLTSKTFEVQKAFWLLFDNWTNISILEKEPIRFMQLQVVVILKKH